jgi:hypothetical protein
MATHGERYGRGCLIAPPVPRYEPKAVFRTIVSKAARLEYLITVCTAYPFSLMETVMRKSILLSAALLAAACNGARAQEALGTNGGPDVRFSGCILYEHANFGGHTFTVRGNYNLSYIGGRWNDKVSSIACNPYCEVTVFEHRDFQGASRRFGANIQYVGDGWNDRISSARVRCSR